MGAGALGAGCSFATGGGRPERLNVVLVILDSVRSDFVATYGSRRVETPNITGLAADGLRFRRFFPEAMPTVPARRAIMTGRRVFPFRGWQRTPDLGRGPGSAAIANVDETFTRALQRAGYWTASASDNPFLAFTRSFRPFRLSFDRYVSIIGHSGSRNDPATVSDASLEQWLPEGLRGEERYREGMRRYLANTGYGEDDAESSAARVFASAIQLLEQGARRQPFALVVDCFDPHEPWSPPPEFVGKYAHRDYGGPNPGTVRYGRADDYLRDDELRQARAVYAASLTIADKWLGRLLERFRALGLHESTALVFLSDHGILLGERGWTGKIAKELHPELIQVPCIMVHPERKRAGATSSYFASTHDIAPTLLSLAGVPTPSHMDGQDLSPLFDRDELPERPFAYGGYFNHFYVRNDHWSYIADNRGQQRELYDLDLDRPELTNVAEQHPEVHEELHARLTEAIGGLPPYYTGEAVEPGRG